MNLTILVQAIIGYGMIALNWSVISGAYKAFKNRQDEAERGKAFALTVAAIPLSLGSLCLVPYINWGAISPLRLTTSLFSDSAPKPKVAQQPPSVPVPTPASLDTFTPEPGDFVLDCPMESARAYFVRSRRLMAAMQQAAPVLGASSADMFRLTPGGSEDDICLSASSSQSAEKPNEYMIGLSSRAYGKSIAGGCTREHELALRVDRTTLKATVRMYLPARPNDPAFSLSYVERSFGTCVKIDFQSVIPQIKDTLESINWIEKTKQQNKEAEKNARKI